MANRKTTKLSNDLARLKVAVEKRMKDMTSEEVKRGIVFQTNSQELLKVTVSAKEEMVRRNCDRIEELKDLVEQWNEFTAEGLENKTYALKQSIDELKSNLTCKEPGGNASLLVEEVPRLKAKVNTAQRELTRLRAVYREPVISEKSLAIRTREISEEILRGQVQLFENLKELEQLKQLRDERQLMVDYLVELLKDRQHLA